MTESKKKSVRELLFSKDQKTVTKTINKLRETGKDTDLNTLVELYGKSEAEEIKQLIYKFLCDLKSQASAAVVVGLIQTTTDKQTLKMLASTCWQSRLNYIDNFELFIDLIIHEPFEISFEAFTLLENFEEKTTEIRKTELTVYVKSNIKDCKEDNLPLAVDLVQIIENYKV